MISRRRVTIHQVAEMARVSTTTVSYVLNNKGHIPENTRQKVLEVIAELGYVPDGRARSLKSNRAGMIELLFTYAEESVTSSRYFRDITASICATAAHLGYRVVVSVIPRNRSFKAHLNTILQERLVGGVIVAGPTPEQVQVLQQVVEDLPAIILSASSEDERISYIDVDNREGMALAVQYLVGCGYRCIIYATPDQMDSHALQRYHAYQETIKVHGLQESSQILTLASNAGDEELVRSAILKGQTAIIAFDDLRALEINSILTRAGLQVPQDVALVGFDDEDFAYHMSPRLTTLAQPFSEMGKLAAQKLIERLENTESTASKEILPLRLVVRESCRDLNKAA